MENWITTQEAAELMGVDNATIRKWAIGGKKITAKKFGRDWMIDPASLTPDLRSKAGKPPVRQPKLTPRI